MTLAGSSREKMAEAVELSDLVWLQKHCWRLLPEWHEDTGWTLRCSYYDPAKPLASQTLETPSVGVSTQLTWEGVLLHARTRLTEILGP